jgi:predicted kinase
MNENVSSTLIIIGGFAGTGKTAITKRLSAELRWPRLGSDTIGRTIKSSEGMPSHEGNAYWIAYDLLFRLCAEFLQAGISTILDLTMGWEFQWQRIEQILGDCPPTRFFPVLLTCSQETVMRRIRQRHQDKPNYYDPPETYQSEPKILKVQAFLAQLERPDLYRIDADRPFDAVYRDIYEYIMDPQHGKPEHSYELVGDGKASAVV